MIDDHCHLPQQRKLMGEPMKRAPERNVSDCGCLFREDNAEQPPTDIGWTRPICDNDLWRVNHTHTLFESSSCSFGNNLS
ncbi:hypothetical protein L1887_31159 [Cichorium endivia]|nr:hypothetical protein L1887_31159 [Cichorium endivia]